MKLKHSIMVGMLGRYADRFHEYKPSKDLRERLEMVKMIEKAEGIEIVYPSEFENIHEAIHLIKESGFQVSALNLNLKSQNHWRQGSFTSPDPIIRAAAVEELKSAMDLAVELGTDMVSCCPLIDGHNYNFEVNYLEQWSWLEECLASGASHRTDVRLSLEYKLNECRNHNILSGIGNTLYLCERLGLSHVGVTVDVGHALIALETPAESICMAALPKRLFYVHFNDNARDWDWDMQPGSVHVWDLIETVYYLDKINWEGWLSYDVVTRHGDLVKSMEVSINAVEIAIKLLDKIGREKITSLIEAGNPPQTFDHLLGSLL